jgi:hypothetical protein
MRCGLRCAPQGRVCLVHELFRKEVREIQGVLSLPDVGNGQLCSGCIPQVHCFAVLVELRLNRFLKFFAIRPVTCTLCSNRERWTRRTTGLYRNVSEPFRNADGRFFHLRLVVLDFPTLGSLSTSTNEIARCSAEGTDLPRAKGQITLRRKLLLCKYRTVVCGRRIRHSLNIGNQRLHIAFAKRIPPCRHERRFA